MALSIDTLSSFVWRTFFIAVFPLHDFTGCLGVSYACFMHSILLLPVYSLFKCFRSSHACHVCSVLFLPVYSLFKCFRSSHACHMCLVLFLPVYSLLKCFGGSYTCFMTSILLLPVYSLFKCFRSSHACHMYPVLFLPVYSLFKCFRSSLICFADFVSVSSLITVPQTVTLFYISLRSQAPQRQYTVCSFSSMRRNGHSHKLTSSRALRYYTVGIPWFLGQRWATIGNSGMACFRQLEAWRIGNFSCW